MANGKVSVKKSPPVVVEKSPPVIVEVKDRDRVRPKKK